MARFGGSLLAEMMELQRRMDELFEEARAETRRMPRRPQIAPPVDVIRREDAYVIKMDLPGVRAEDITVSAGDGVITVRGEKRQNGSSDRKVLRRERRYGEFLRPVPMPSDADLSEVEAKLEKGVLTVTVARRRAPKGRVIPVKEVEE